MTADISFTLFESVTATMPIARELPWLQLADRLATHEERAAKGGAGWSPATYRPGATRSVEGIESMTAVVFDFDHATPAWALLAGLEYVAATTWQYLACDDYGESCEHWRVTIPLTDPCPVDQWGEVWARAKHWLAPDADESCKDASRFFWWPSTRTNGPRDTRRQQGQPLDWRSLPPIPRADQAMPSRPTYTKYEGNERPGDLYNRETSWADVLPRWTLVRERGTDQFWRRPGSKRRVGWCATTNVHYLFVFCNSAAPFEANTAYSKFAVYAHLNHRGDFAAAARELGQRDTKHSRGERAGQTEASSDDADEATESRHSESVKGGKEENEKESRAEAARLMRLIYTDCEESQRPELFRSSDGEPYACVPVGDHFETWGITSLGFRDWLQRQFYLRTRRPLGEQGLKVSLGLFSAIARFDGPTRSVHVRVANEDGRIYVDLGDPQWRVIEIGPNTWFVTDQPPVRFRRARGMLALPMPTVGGAVDELRPFLNVSAQSWPLVVSWLVMALRGRGPFPVIVLIGEQGSGKTTAARVLRSLLDPSSSPDRAEPREERDLAVAARNSYAVVIDNLSRLPRWLSDAFSRLATGAGLTTRQLFTDNEEIFFFATRPVALNGISEFVQRSDLLDRSLLIELQHIPENERRSEAAFWAAFEAARPRIFGALLTVVAAALAREDAVRLTEVPRMADYARWLTAAEDALGWAPGSFLAAYRANRSTAHALALDASVIVAPLRELPMPWEGTSTELLKALTARVEPAVTHQEGWPRGPRALSGSLRALVPNLRADGIEVTFPGPHGHKRSRILRIARVASASSATGAEAGSAD